MTNKRWYISEERHEGLSHILDSIEHEVMEDSSYLNGTCDGVVAHVYTTLCNKVSPPMSSAYVHHSYDTSTWYITDYIPKRHKLCKVCNNIQKINVMMEEKND